MRAFPFVLRNRTTPWQLGTHRRGQASAESGCALRTSVAASVGRALPNQAICLQAHPSRLSPRSANIARAGAAATSLASCKKGANLAWSAATIVSYRLRSGAKEQEKTGA